MRARHISALVLSAGVAAVALLPSGRPTPSPASSGSGAIVLTAAPGQPGGPSISDSLAGQPILKLSSGGTGLGVPVTGTVRIANQSSAPLTVSLAQQNLTWGPSGKPDLAALATLAVVDSTTGATLYSGPLDRFTGSPINICGATASRTTACPRWAAGEQHQFSFTVVIPVPSGDSQTVNSYQGTTLSADYLWTSAT